MTAAAARKTAKRIAYIRVSSVDQHTDRQLESINAASPDKIFTDKCSGKDTKRPQLAALLSYAREGDTVLVHSLDRLGRNLDDLRKLVVDLNGRGITVQFLKENLTFTGDDSDTSLSKLMFNGEFLPYRPPPAALRQAASPYMRGSPGQIGNRRRIILS